MDFRQSGRHLSLLPQHNLAAVSSRNTGSSFQCPRTSRRRAFPRAGLSIGFVECLLMPFFTCCAKNVKRWASAFQIFVSDCESSPRGSFVESYFHLETSKSSEGSHSTSLILSAGKVYAEYNPVEFAATQTVTTSQTTHDVLHLPSLKYGKVESRYSHVPLMCGHCRAFMPLNCDFTFILCAFLPQPRREQRAITIFFLGSTQILTKLSS